MTSSPDEVQTRAVAGTAPTEPPVVPNRSPSGLNAIASPLACSTLATVAPLARSHSFTSPSWSTARTRRASGLVIASLIADASRSVAGVVGVPVDRSNTRTTPSSHAVTSRLPSRVISALASDAGCRMPVRERERAGAGVPEVRDPAAAGGDHALAVRAEPRADDHVPAK